MNIPIIAIGLEESINLHSGCRPYTHFFIICDSITSFLSCLNNPIEKYFTNNRDELVCDSILRDNFNMEKQFFKQIRKMKPLVTWNNKHSYKCV